MKPPREKRRKRRYEVSIPALMRDAAGEVMATGLVQHISGSGALLTNVTGDLKVGARGRVRLMKLSQSLRTPSTDTMELEAEVVRNTMAGFALRFLSATRELEALLTRAMGRGAIDDPED